MDAIHGPGKAFGIIAGPLSIEVVNNESVFSEAIDHLKKIEDGSGGKIESARVSLNKSNNFMSSHQGQTLAGLL